MIPSLWSLFFEEEAPPAITLKRIEESAEFESLRHQLRGQVDATFWGSAVSAIGDGLRSVLDVSLLEVLLRAWTTHPAVAGLRAAHRESSDIVLVELGEHEIVSRHLPRIEVRADSRVLGELRFEVHLNLMVQRARLQLGNGRLVRGTVGACSGSGWIALGNVEIASFSVFEIPVPSQISFGAGLTLPVDIAADAEATVQGRR
ncbi:MAG TPA: hypothetical protein VJ826_01160 [Candidatus Polarisedimenticolaceae bacterium]|nr:hypothetical protein [Candidatus Polarisedimenticolaceae bacterium]